MTLLSLTAQLLTPQVARAADLKLLSVEHTALFVRERGALFQVARVVVENAAEPVSARLEVRLDSETRSSELGKVNKGKATFEVPVPDVSEPTPMEFVLHADGKPQGRRKLTWQPQRRWEVCLIPLAHHDLGYTATIEDVFRQYDGYYDDVLRFCDETADWPEEAKFRYTVEGTWSIQHFLENRPKEVIAKLAKYVREGRIEIPALFGNEVSGLCSHEELIRLMYPSFRIKRQLGAPIRTASITDIPGLSWGLPTVLAGAGVKYFFAGLPTYFEWRKEQIGDVHTFWDEPAILRQGRPDAFYWEGPDGQTVLVYYQGGYGNLPWKSFEELFERLPGRLTAMQKQGCPFSVMRWGYDCGDNRPPNIRVSHIVREWNSRWAYPRLIVATSSMFFERLEKQCRDLRTFRGDLPDTDYVVGAASTAQETGINRLAHDRLHAAEKAAAIASVVAGQAYPGERIRDAYDSMLLYDEHTWGMAHQVGRLQDWNWSDKSRYAYKAAGLAESVLNVSLARIGDSISREEGRYVAVFNPLSFTRTDVVRLANWDAREPFDLVDEESGKKAPYQIVEIDGPRAPLPHAAGRHARGQFQRAELFDLVFVAEDVPSLGYKTYRIVPAKQSAPVSGSVAVGENTLENRFYRVTLDPQTGAVESIYDKELSREMVDKDAPHKLNQLVARWVKTGTLEVPPKARIRKGQTGPVYGSLIVSGEGPGCPQLTQEIILYDTVKRIELNNRVLKDSTAVIELYFAFPFRVDKPGFRFEATDSVMEPLADQFPGSNSNYYPVQHWAEVSDGQIGVTLCPLEAHLVEFGGLWPCYVSQAHHGVTPPDFGRPFVGREELRKGHLYSFVLSSNFRTNFQSVQQGDLLFRYAITTHRGDWKAGRPRDVGWAVANPLVPVLVSGKRQGTLPKRMSFAEVDQPNVLLLTLKRAEDGQGIILRLVETEGKQTTASVKLPHLAIRKAFRTNLVEEDEQELSFTAQTITATIKPFGLTTIRLHVP